MAGIALGSRQDQALPSPWEVLAGGHIPEMARRMWAELQARPLETASASGIPVVSDLADARLAGRDIARAAQDPSWGNIGRAAASAGLAALPFVGIGAVRGAGSSGSVIADWRWRPVKEVVEQVGVKEVPGHVLDFGRYMTEMATKAKRGELGARDLVKAFTITRASIQRQAQTVDKLKERWPDFPGQVEPGGKIRPEGAFSEWLLTPTGKRYLDAAEKGEVDLDAIKDAADKLGGYGKQNDLIAALADATALPGQEGRVGEMIAAAFDKPGKGLDAWREWTRSLPGIGPAKSGFVASMLGRGDQPTLDARQLLLQTGRPTAEAHPYLKRRNYLGAEQATDRLARRQAEMNLQGVPPELEPFRQHLTHHTLWDAYGQEVTTHEDLIRAMRLAGLLGPTVGITIGSGLPPAGASEEGM